MEEFFKADVVVPLLILLITFIFGENIRRRNLDNSDGSLLQVKR